MMHLNESTYYHIYDLSLAPTSFNFVLQAVAGELARKELTDCTHTHMVFVPGAPEDGGFTPNKTHLSTREKKWRFGNIVLPAIDLIPAITSYSILENREQVEPFLDLVAQKVFPIGYKPTNQALCGMSLSTNLNCALGYEIPSLRAPDLALDYVKKLVKRVCGESKFVTITIRDTNYTQDRNSRLNIWRSVSDYFRKNGYQVFILPDYEQVFEVEDSYFDGAYTCRECVLDLRLRFALYELADLNLGQGGGPMAALTYDDACKYVISRMVVESTGVATADFMKGMGFDVGKDNGFFDTYNRWLWTEDDEQNILSVCEEFVEIERSQGESHTLNRASSVAAFEALQIHYGVDVAQMVFSKMGRSAPVFLNKEYNQYGELENVLRYLPSLKAKSGRKTN